ncbi:hypothetical protein [Formosa haliotis]|uniref:hypothetical protein n=1 Tax=Formosa haliotis TaxID=1555194 RepID=UPI000826BD57|nr:hypothetical protein [Formosa haliotis]
MITKTTYKVPSGTTFFNTSFLKQFALYLVFGLLSFGAQAQDETVIILDQPGSGTFVAPCGVSKIFVEVWGAGSAGGGSISSNRGGLKGLKGRYGSKEYTLPVEGLKFDYIIGEGGKGIIGKAGTKPTDPTQMTGG